LEQFSYAMCLVFVASVIPEVLPLKEITELCEHIVKRANYVCVSVFVLHRKRGRNVLKLSLGTQVNPRSVHHGSNVKKLISIF
jgi:hypothetical protein